MADTYCGKSCENCACKDTLQCPGCKNGPGRSWSGECQLASCCIEKGHETCETCSHQAACGIYRGRNTIPEYRLRTRERTAAQKARLAEKSVFLGKWLWILFWLVIPISISNITTNELVVNWLPALYLPGQLLNGVCLVAYGLILLKLKLESDHYSTSGICRIVSATVWILLTCITGGADADWTLLLTIPIAIISIIGEHHEYRAHAEILLDASSELSAKWDVLWKWYIGSFAAMFGGLLLAAMIPLLGLLLILAASVALLVVSILKLVYLYRAAKIFRECASEQKACPL